MKTLVEIHMLQNFAPSLLNRDDTGAPKDCDFGSVRRARISSQCLKRAAREYVRDNELVAPDNLAARSKRLVSTLAELVAEHGHDKDEAMKVTEIALSGLSLSVDEGKTQYLLFLGQQELQHLAQEIHNHWDEVSKLVEKDAEDSKKKKSKKDAKANVPKDLIKAMEAALDGGKAVDLALFGRMLADLPSKNRDAACQVAHALSTNAVSREFDFYTAVDDLQPEDTSGADMLGTVEFNSACYYRYAALDISKLVENLQDDEELALHGLQAFIKASVYALPSGKQNSFAAHNLPNFVAVTVRQDASPMNLANAFEKPARGYANKSLSETSLEQLADYWHKMGSIYSQQGAIYFVNVSGGDVKPLTEHLNATSVSTVDGLLEHTLADVKDTFGAA